MKGPRHLITIVVVVLLLGTQVGFVLASEEAASEPLVSMIFIQDDLRDAITELVLQTGVNIIMDESVHGLVTLDLVDVPLDRALRLMTMAGGYQVHKVEDFYFIGSSDPESLSYTSFATTATYELQYITAQDVIDLVPDIYRPYIKTSMFSSLVTVTAPPATLDQVLEMLQSIDRPVPQILIQALVTEISRSELEEWGSNLLSYNRETDVQTTSTSQLSWLDHIIYENTVFSFGFFGKVLSSIRALEAENKAEIKANPRVVVSSGQTVDLFSGETHFLVLSGAAASGHLEEINVGISLNVTPRIVNNDLLQLDITPEVSHMAGQLMNRNAEGLAVRRSSVTTSVLAENQQTLLLAGMTLQQASDHKSQVPILGRLPIIRWFFSEKSQSEEERELLIFVTAEILE
ncbi:MAG: hypothetical protein QM451_08975 [Bacillota bacterium]|jgi:type IV pilus assembly protein PilQ|nr:hypothetical protein [Bacillota bacterium]HHT90814.1 hypothetical protein [Bacillota bacterium]